MFRCKSSTPLPIHFLIDMFPLQPYMLGVKSLVPLIHPTADEKSKTTGGTFRL